MLYRNIKGNNISRISLGTAPYGTRISKETAFDIMDRYYALGGNLFDSAHLYSGGLSEIILGEWIRSRTLQNKVFVSTKGGHPDPSDWIPRITKEAIEHDMEESLRRLKTEHVDVYYLHRDDESKSVEEIMPILDRFVKSGKTGAIGASNWTFARIEEANRFARENGMAEFTYSQIMYSGAKINKEGVPDKTLVVMDDREMAGYKTSDVAVVAYTSQAQGLFSYIQKYGSDGIPDHLKGQYINETTLQRADTVLRIAEETGMSPTALSLGYLIYSEITPIPVIGVSSVARLDESMQALDIPEKYHSEFKK